MGKQTKMTIGGREAVVTDLGRVRGQKGWRFYNLVSVRFVDNGEYLSMGAGEFVKWSNKLNKTAEKV